MFSQDWEPVVLRKQGNNLGHRPTGPSHSQKLDENTENYKDHKRVPKLLADAIRQRRIDLKITQDQLAKKVNVRTVVVNDIESQRGVYDSPTIERIKRVLGITNKSIGLQ
jgi:ribosome-binding protein aMBF1 (putative translation factor)